MAGLFKPEIQAYIKEPSAPLLPQISHTRWNVRAVAPPTPYSQQGSIYSSVEISFCQNEKRHRSATGYLQIFDVSCAGSAQGTRWAFEA